MNAFDVLLIAADYLLATTDILLTTTEYSCVQLNTSNTGLEL
jgi:hypothetical protein